MLIVTGSKIEARGLRVHLQLVVRVGRPEDAQLVELLPLALHQRVTRVILDLHGGPRL